MKRFLVLVCTIALLSSTHVLAGTWYITPDGTGDAPTIQAGIDSSSVGDTVIVACGAYYESGLLMKSGIALVAEDSGCVTIDAQWSDRVFECIGCNGSTLIEGFVVTHGSPAGVGPYEGGGMRARACSLMVLSCVFTGNSAMFGAGAYCEGSPLALIDCTFQDNEGELGAGVFCTNSGPRIVDCTFFRNFSLYVGTICCLEFSSPNVISCTFSNNCSDGGTALHCEQMSSPSVENTIIAYGIGIGAVGDAISCKLGSHPTLRCCDIFGNVPNGDWVGCVADEYGVNGNFSMCPSFCNTNLGDLRLCDGSPCLPGQHPQGYDCGLIGAWGQGCVCGPTRSDASSWGAIKSMYK